MSLKIPRYSITNTIYFEWRSTVLWIRNVFKQYFDDWPVSFKHRIVVFSKTEKKIISQQPCKGPHIYGGHIQGEWPHGGKVLKFVLSMQILLFLNKRYIVHFCRWMGWYTGRGGDKIGHLLWLL